MAATERSRTFDLERLRWRRWLVELPASANAAVSERWRLAAKLVAFVTGWRLLILALSWTWGQLPVAHVWPDGIGSMWLWRYSVRWDSGFYLDIARNGYQYQPGHSSSIAYFPLYPFLIRFTHLLLPKSDVFAALVVSQLALTAAVIYVFRLVELDFGRQVAWRATFLLLIFPTAFFFSAVYPESLLLLMLAGSMYHARRGEWLRAGLFGLGGGATKLVGVVVIVPLLIELWRQRETRLPRPRALLSTAIAPLGSFAYLGYLQLRFGDFRVLFDTEAQWFRHAFEPAFLAGIDLLSGDRTALIHYPAGSVPSRGFFLEIDTLALVLFAAAGVFLWFRVRRSYGALVLAYLMVPAFSGSMQSMNRYVAVLFPVFMLLACIKSEPFRSAIAGVFLCGLVVTSYLFVNGFWAG